MEPNEEVEENSSGAHGNDFTIELLAGKAMASDMYPWLIRDSHTTATAELDAYLVKYPPSHVTCYGYLGRTTSEPMG